MLFGADPVAVDATGTRLMGLDPARLGYLAAADAFLGNVPGGKIAQRGEAVSRFRQNFRVLPGFERARAGATDAG